MLKKGDGRLKSGKDDGMTIRNPFKKRPEKKADPAPAPVAKAVKPAPAVSYRTPSAQPRPTTPSASQQVAENAALYQQHLYTPPVIPDPCPPTTPHHGGSSHSYDGGNSHGSSSYDSGSSSSSYDSGSSGCDSGGGF